MTTAIKIRGEIVSRIRQDRGIAGFEITACPEVIRLLDEYSGEEFSAIPELGLMKIVKHPDPTCHPEHFHIKNI